jgi:hypothetical protein
VAKAGPIERQAVTRKTIDQRAAYALGMARGALPLEYGVTVIVHAYDRDEWSLVTTITNPVELDIVLTNAQRAGAVDPNGRAR